jgi:MFS transporter, SP family, xylose:H+ symportor
MHGPVRLEVEAVSSAVETTGYIWIVAMAAALGGLLFGYDWVVIGGAREFYERYFHLSSTSSIGWANSCALLGCLIGSLAAGSLADRFGRRRVLIVAAALFAISSVLTGWAFSFNSFIVWRIVGGIAIGLASNVSPLYIAELSPPALRGRLVSLNQFAVVVGILLAQIVNWVIARPETSHAGVTNLLYSWNVLYAWRWMFTVLIVPSLIFLLASMFVPESPRWLLDRGRVDEAQNVLAHVGGGAYARTELSRLQQALKAEAPAGAGFGELRSIGVRKVLLLGVALAVLQQWTGVNILFNYAAEVYRNAGYGSNDIFLNIVITGTINLIFTVLAMALVDRIGRRALMLFGCLGIATAHLLCAMAYRLGWHGAPVLVLTLGAIACYALTLAPVTWVLIAEIFPNRIRSQGVSIAVSALWISSFALTYTFPWMNQAFGTGSTFFVYGAICALGSLLVYTSVPETKGKSLEEIESCVIGG